MEGSTREPCHAREEEEAPLKDMVHVPSRKEYSSSKVTSHMPLIAVEFDRNGVQCEECTRRGGQAELRADGC